jgi:predicted MFS family arabinose efflux permease
VGRFYKSIGPRRLIAGGLFVTGWLMLVSLLLNKDSSLWLIRLQILSMGFAMAFALIPMQVTALANIRPDETGQASAILNTCRRVAIAFGVAILATILTLAMPDRTHATGASLIGPFRYVFAAGAAMAFLGMLCALAIRDTDAAATLAPDLAPSTKRVEPVAAEA